MKPVYGMPYPFMWPMPQWPTEQAQQPVSDDIVPARVNKAMEFMAMLTHKTMQRAAISEIAIELIDGQRLSPEEEYTATAALQLLSRYFDGKLKPDMWEMLPVAAMKRQAERGNIPGQLLHCIACTPGPANPRCPLCHGTGRIMVTPVGPAQQDGEYEEPDDGPQGGGGSPKGDGPQEGRADG